MQTPGRRLEAPRAPRRLHASPAAVAAVLGGGAFGAAARQLVAGALPARGGLPWGTLAVNWAGAFLLGLLLEALVRAGSDEGWRRRARLWIGTGFMGAFTTYSALAVETVQLWRHGRPALAVGYLGLSVLGGLAAAAAGIRLGSLGGTGAEVLPIDPDLDPLTENGGP